MFKKCGMCLFLVICIMFSNSYMVYGQGAKDYGVEDSSAEIGAIEFYTLLVDSLASEKVKVPEYADWCNPQMRVLADMGLLEPIEMLYIEQGYYSAASFVDKGLGLIGYTERPLVFMDYVGSLEIVLKELGIMDKLSFNLTSKMTIKEAYDFIDILKELKKQSLKKLTFEDDEAIVKYKIDDFVDNHKCYWMIKGGISALPQKYIDLFNDKNYTMVITDSLERYDDESISGRYRSMMSSDEKRVYFTPMSFLDIGHEFGHVVALDGIPNSDIILKYLYFWEGEEVARLIGRPYAKSNPDEFFACLFSELLYLDESLTCDKLALDNLREKAPLSTHFVYDIVISADSIYDVDLYNKFLKDNRIFVNE